MNRMRKRSGIMRCPSLRLLTQGGTRAIRASWAGGGSRWPKAWTGGYNLMNRARKHSGIMRYPEAVNSGRDMAIRQPPGLVVALYGPRHWVVRLDKQEDEALCKYSGVAS
ncbi:uncharacterized protein LOC127750918 [Frankliniella occidentalis]|uniref:Uncharacterized protein LOC127750918 n=1 Tax=Frankliniella occidentalis TaxID=133901 RepID=A0A9C6X5N2_FRAOC|nr:uncharacterized protein LOC127750918 [Frankliniella occidentalis]XP_052129565.1 uncharacterized protein LOC127750918 [Frankliniella occidentalis]